MRLNFNALLFSSLMHSLFLLAIIFSFSFSFSFSFFSPIANASLLEENQNMRTISFTLRDNDKPVIEAIVAGNKIKLPILKDNTNQSIEFNDTKQVIYSSCGANSNL